MIALANKKLRRIATDGKFAERPKDLAVFPGDVDRHLAAQEQRAALLQESLEEIERSGCALGGEHCNKGLK